VRGVAQVPESCSREEGKGMHAGGRKRAEGEREGARVERRRRAQRER
jgi:hypothetical protein